MTQWQVGDVRITKVVEFEATVPPPLLLPEANADDLARIDWLTPHYLDARGRLRFSVHALLLETPRCTVLVDACVGNDKTGRDLPFWNQRQGSFLTDLERAGFPPERIDFVLCTHLHGDHVGWNTRLVEGQWRPTFPRARHLIGRREFRYWQSRSDRAEARAVQVDSLDPLFAAGLVDLIEPPQRVCPEVELIATPGHTPGHVSVAIESRGARALITGDLIHHPCQFAYPDWACVADVSPAEARATRVELCTREADSALLILGTHFVEPSGGRLVRAGARGYRFVP